MIFLWLDYAKDIKPKEDVASKIESVIKYIIEDMLYYEKIEGFIKFIQDDTIYKSLSNDLIFFGTIKNYFHCNTFEYVQNVIINYIKNSN